jgi:hypothetical protein
MPNDEKVVKKNKMLSLQVALYQMFVDLLLIAIYYLIYA